MGRGFRATLATAASLALLPLGGCDGDEPNAEWMDVSVPRPTLFAPGTISGELRDYDITFMPDGREAYFTRRSRRGPPQIFQSRWEDGAWTEPELAPFSTDRDEAPFISPDGSRMVFASRRPTPGGWDRSDNIWIMERGPEGWSDPEPIAGVVNQPRHEITEDFTAGSELGPTLLANGLLLYWTRLDPDWGSDLYVAEPDHTGVYQAPSPLRVNSPGDETNPVMSPDGRYLIFQAYRDADGFGDQDLYVSRRTEYGWTDPELLPAPINSQRNDAYPSFSPDGRFFFFATDRDSRGGYYDIYYVDTTTLGLDSPE